MTEIFTCRNIRELLGVYVLGAIEPAERSIVDEHLAHCRDCREELAGLAGLPALLRRVPLADAERLAAEPPLVEAPVDTYDEVLSGLLAKVAARRRGRRLRSAFATAAAVVLATAGGAAISHAIAAQNQPAQFERVQAAAPGGIGIVVQYGSSKWGTAMWVRVHGIRPGTACQFWVLTRGGHREAAGGWTVLGGTASQWWYPAESSVPEHNVTGFELTTGHQVLVRVPLVV